MEVFQLINEKGMIEFLEKVIEKIEKSLVFVTPNKFRHLSS